MEFAIGQRCVSETENDLGLGIVTAVEYKQIRVLFPAAEEERIYASDNNPLIRMAFEIGDLIKHVDGWQLKIEDITEEYELLTYHGLTEDNEPASFNELELDHSAAFSKPQELLFIGQIDKNDRFALRYRALNYQKAQFQSEFRGLQGARASLIPHQLYIGAEVGNRNAPRVLLADEVGLGKTIEACLIMHQQLLQGKINRVLILVPENLQHQWLVELKRRFNLNFALYNEQRLQRVATDDLDEQDIDDNPFEQDSLVLASLNWLAQNKKQAQQLVTATWDMLIVDEAHHLRWDEEQPSPSYRLVEVLASITPSVILLTATPEQLGLQSHFARLRLLDPIRFHDYQQFIAEQNQYSVIAEVATSLLNKQILSTAEQNILTELLAEQDIEPWLKIINYPDADPEQQHNVRQELISNLIDRHGTSRILFRNTRQEVKGFPQRTLHQIILDGIHAEGNTKADWLTEFLKNKRDEKTLVICNDVATSIELEQKLREKEGLRVALFHENMSIIDRDKAAAYFSAQEYGASVLICSSIGSEGRNFQFASILVIYDLPNHPDLLEQCIGRLDRIGQAKDIDIYVPAVENSYQDLLCQWFHQGLDAFEHTCSMGATIYNEYQAQLEQCLSQNRSSEEFAELIKLTQKTQQKLKHELENGRDRLLELNSNGGEKGQLLAEKISEIDDSPELVDFSLNLFDLIGFDQDDLGQGNLFIQPTGHMLVPSFPGIDEDGCSLTFNRQEALVREDLEFITWDHPIVRNGIDLILTGNIGKTALGVLINPNLPTGTLFLELIYVLETHAPRDLQLEQFLPPTAIRLLLDSNGNNLAEQVSFETLNAKLKAIPKKVATQIMRATQKDIRSALAKGDIIIQDKITDIIDIANQQAEKQLNFAIQRMQVLSAVNPNIRPEEIQILEEQLEQANFHIQQANCHLDSIRVIVTKAKA